MGSKQKKGGKTRRPSAISKRTKRSKAVKGAKNDPICSVAREFLYECPGGMDTNEMRDKFLECAKRDEQKGRPLHNVVGNVVRASFFQGQQVGKDAAEVVGSGPRKKLRKKQGPLTSGDTMLLRRLAVAIGDELNERLEPKDHTGRSNVQILVDGFIEARTCFDQTGEEPDLWESQITETASAIIQTVLDCAKRGIQRRIGEKSWKDLGLAHF